VSGSGPRLGVVVVAAGSGERLAAPHPKALVLLAGRPLLAHALAGLAAAGLPPPVVVHTPGQGEGFALAAGDLAISGLVPGGATRTASVASGIAALPEDVEVVAIHDAARPLTPPQVIGAAVAAVADAADVLAAAPGVPVADTLKRTVAGEVIGTVDRTGLVGVQTPQVFPRTVIDRVLDPTGPVAEVTDDLALVERLRDRGELEGRIVVVPGSVWAHKVTYPSDLALLEVLAQHAAPDAAGRGGGA
jgi:2-C-methyl-D-erythritol 4-phosphate cytidylyltransferase